LHITHWTSEDLARQAVTDGIVPAISARAVRLILHDVDLQPCPFGKRVKSVRLVPGWAGGQWAFGWRTDLPMVDTARWRDEAGPVGRW
jgi:hypothetical protein